MIVTATDRYELNALMQSYLSRRELLAVSVGTAAFWLGGVGCASAASGRSVRTIGQVVTELRRGRMTAVAHIESMLRRGQARASLNAFIRHTTELAMTHARAVDAAIAAQTPLGPLAGVAFAIKDNIDVAGVPTTAGTPGLMANTPRTHAPVVKALIDAGGVVIGKANMHEMAVGITTNNSAFGPAHNPYDPALIPGGSSGGTAVAVAAGLATAGLGTDTGGSCRIPAALCGIVGFRPTIARYSQRGIVPISSTRDTAGPIARSVADIVALDQVCATRQQPAITMSLPGLRVGVPRGHFYAGLERQLAAVVEAALTRLDAAGVSLVEADIPDVAALNRATGPIALYELLRELSAYLYQTGSDTSIRAIIDQIASSSIKRIYASQLDPDKAVSAEVYRAALTVHRPRLQAAYADYFKRNDIAALIVPTTPVTARPIGHDKTIALNGEQVPTFATYIRNTDPPSNAGLPCLSLPAGLTASGLPVGMELVGPVGSDHRLLAIGHAIEAAFPPLEPPQGARIAR